ncbi:MAG: glycerol-3-phosphate 1-O-acyltransferase PlsY [Elusimicrobiota bacterium]|nr:glycerol-3-phosphate 1-O-acyltransferase PlsY [Endomicrobiia bacterium]MDW8166320.1 glycerol-3-phosphate 1-O-acyltransferase PlsY [Elusimicrobiota bacterium]
MIFFLIIFSYLLGSIPTAFILVKVFQGKDIRKMGSGNPGTTNVIRSSGLLLGLITFIIDFLKGYIPIIITLKSYPQYIYISMFFVILGHIYSIFLKFKGGKGVATFFGVLFGISPKIFVISGIFFIISLLLTHIVSISSLISVIVSMFLFAFIEKHNIISKLTFFLIISIIILRHKENIIRLINKQEKRIF